MLKNKFLKIHFFNLLAIIFIAVFLFINYFKEENHKEDIVDKQLTPKKQKKIKLSTTFIEFSTNVSISIYNIEKKDKENISNVIAGTQNIFQYFEKEMNPININSTLYKFNETLNQNVNKFFKIMFELTTLFSFLKGA